MRIAYLTNRYPSPSHTFIRREIRALEALGHEVIRFSHRAADRNLVDEEDREEVSRTRVLLSSPIALAFSVLQQFARYPKGTCQALVLCLQMASRADQRWVAHLAYFAQACRLVRWMGKTDCQHVHVHFGTNPADVAFLANILSGISFSVTCHGPHEFDPNLSLNLDLKLQNARFIITISEKGQADLIARFPTLRQRILLISCGLNSFWLEETPADGGALVSNLPPSEVPLLLCVARLSPQKDLGTLIQAAGILNQKTQNFRIIIAGEGSERQYLENEITTRRLGHCVELVGWQDQSQVKQYLKRAQALVLSSIDEGLPVAIMEAFATDTPVIATDVGGVSELVQPGQTGWLVPPKNPVALAQAMEDCLNTPAEIRISLASHARQLVRKHDIHLSAQHLQDAFAKHAHTL